MHACAHAAALRDGGRWCWYRGTVVLMGLAVVEGGVDCCRIAAAVPPPARYPALPCQRLPPVCRDIFRPAADLVGFSDIMFSREIEVRAALGNLAPAQRRRACGLHTAAASTTPAYLPRCQVDLMISYLAVYADAASDPWGTYANNAESLDAVQKRWRTVPELKVGQAARHPAAADPPLPYTLAIACSPSERSHHAPGGRFAAGQAAFDGRVPQRGHRLRR